MTTDPSHPRSYVPPRERIFPGWAELGLADPPLDGKLPAGAATADILAYILMPPGTMEPVEGLIEGIQMEVMAGAQILMRLHRQLEAAILFHRRISGRAPTPPDLDADTATEPPSERAPAAAAPTDR